MTEAQKAEFIKANKSKMKNDAIIAALNVSKSQYWRIVKKYGLQKQAWTPGAGAVREAERKKKVELILRQAYEVATGKCIDIAAKECGYADRIALRRAFNQHLLGTKSMGWNDYKDQISRAHGVKHGDPVRRSGEGKKNKPSKEQLAIVTAAIRSNMLSEGEVESRDSIIKRAGVCRLVYEGVRSKVSKQIKMEQAKKELDGIKIREALYMRAEGYSWAECTDKLGMSETSLRLHMTIYTRELGTTVPKYLKSIKQHSRPRELTLNNVAWTKEGVACLNLSTQ